MPSYLDVWLVKRNSDRGSWVLPWNAICTKKHRDTEVHYFECIHISYKALFCITVAINLAARVAAAATVVSCDVTTVVVTREHNDLCNCRWSSFYYCSYYTAWPNAVRKENCDELLTGNLWQKRLQTFTVLCWLTVGKTFMAVKLMTTLIRQSDQLQLTRRKIRHWNFKTCRIQSWY